MKKIGSLLIAFISLVCLNSCGDDDDLQFSFDDNGECYSTAIQPLAEQVFRQIAEGYGWKEVDTHEIGTDGKPVRTNYWKDMIGGGPGSFEVLEGGKIKQFVNAMAIPASGYYIHDYTYEPGTNRLRTINGGSMNMQILSASATCMTVLQYHGMRADGKKVYVYSTFERMTAGELEASRSNHLVNLLDVKELELSKPDGANVVDGKTFEFDVLQYTNNYTVKLDQEDNADVRQEGCHVTIDIKKNGVKLTVCDQIDSHSLQLFIFSTDESLEPKGEGQCQVDMTEMTMDSGLNLYGNDGRKLSHAHSEIRFSVPTELSTSERWYWEPRYVAVVDEDKQVNFIAMDRGRILIKDILPATELKKICDKGPGTITTYKLEMINQHGTVTQVTPLKVTCKD